MGRAFPRKKSKSSSAWLRPSPLMVGNFSLLLVLLPLAHAASGGPTELVQGFTASPEQDLPSSVPAFQPLLRDPTGNYSLGFLVSDNLLDLAVVHVPSSVPLWRAAATLQWSQSVSVSFNGALALSDPRSGILWSTNGQPGDRVILLPSSNLQVLGGGGVVRWQSFDHPADTIIQGQNLSSSMALTSPGGKYAMRLGPSYIGLYMVFPARWRQPMYWKEGALQATAQIEADKGPIYARLNSSGFLGLYQIEGRPVHIMPFSSYNQQRPTPSAATTLWRLSLEADGALRGYYWNGTLWIADYVSIPETCDLPAPCGAYGLCRPEGSGGECSCLSNVTATCPTEDTGDMCGAGGDYWVLRRTGVDLAYKEPLGYTKMKSLDDCESACAKNCSCWGAVYHNATGACYMMDFPVETLVADGGRNKLGYFKVRQSSSVNRSKRKKGALAAGVGLLVIAVLVLGGVVGVAVWRRQKGGGGGDRDVDGLAAGPYRDLKQTSSFGSMELTSSFRK